MQRTARLILLGVGLAIGAPAEATTFTVTSTADSGINTLRQAILDANANINVVDLIAFNLPGPSFTIQPTTPLPTITDPVTIDGYTQIGTAPNDDRIGTNAVLLVEVNGALAGDTDGLLVEHVTNLGAGTTIRGLVINGFNNNLRAGIRINDDGNNRIEGTFIGTDVSGLLARPNSDGVAVALLAAGNHIGDATLAARNLISGNSNRGVVLDTNDNVVEGNLIGTDRSGGVALGNDAGIVLFNFAANNVIGGLGLFFNPAENVISGNLNGGIIIGTNSIGHDIISNKIGVGADGLTTLGNGTGAAVQVGGNGATLTENQIAGNATGISISGVSGTVVQGNLIGLPQFGNANNGITIIDGNDNLIGGATGDRSNIISGNGGVGVQVVRAAGTANGNAILLNSIYANDLLGIELVNGANNGQLAPQLSAASGRTASHVEGSLVGAPLTSYRLQFFGNTVCDLSGFGEGEAFIGELVAATDGAGLLTFDATLAGVIGKPFITATATDPQSDTSEFSNCVLNRDALATRAPALGPGGLGLAMLALVAVAGRAVRRHSAPQ